MESLEDSGVDKGEVELVDAVVVEEEGKSLGYIFFVVGVAFGVAEGAAHQHGGSVTDVAGDDGFGEFGLAKMGEGGVDGVAEIDPGVDESAVKIEHKEARNDVESHSTMVAGEGRRI
jgi:hypothetical protein